jgi:hypothetical protein
LSKGSVPVKPNVNPQKAAAFESFELEAGEESGGEVSVSGLDKWLAIAASLVALLSMVSTFMAYSAVK